MPKIAKRTVDAAKPKKKRFIVWHDQVRGFGLLVLPSGVKSYLFNYRTPEGREKRIFLGKHGDLTADQARKLAEGHRHAVVAHGADPLGQRQVRRNALTVDDVIDAYLASEVFGDKTEVTRAIDRGRINRHLRPLLGKRHAHALTEQDIRQALNAIRDGKDGGRRKDRPSRPCAGPWRSWCGSHGDHRAIDHIQLGDPQQAHDGEPVQACRGWKARSLRDHGANSPGD
jgi:Arm DNA-binding domain